VTTHTTRFDEYVDEHHGIVGGKCASLGAMTVAGLPVPPGFAVTTHAFHDSLGRQSGVHSALGDALTGLDVTDMALLAEAGDTARRTVLDNGPAGEVEAAIRVAYADLCARTGIPDVPVAVRSSATAEDQPDASFAGQQDTYLWIKGADEVVNHVVRCWASLYTDRAISYRAESGYSNLDVAMAVAVQQMVLPKCAGVAFTIDPTNGDRSKVVIDSAWGLGETVVSGSVTPDNYVVDKVIYEIVKRTVSVKECELVVEGGEVVHRELEGDRATEPSITDDEIKALARLARQAEKHFGRPQDTEWAIDHEGVLFLLQSRPETVWSNKPRQSVSAGAGAGMEGILKTLMTPVKVRPNN
jgi:pyruvate, water dikinase